LNSKLSGVELIGDIRGRPSLLMINSTGIISSCWNADAKIIDSHLEGMGVSSYSHIYMINSTYENLDNLRGKSGIYIGWHLTVSVESGNQPVKGANVEVYYAHNGSLAAQKVTPSDGKVRFDLMEWDGPYYVGDYRIKASYNDLKGEETISLRSSKQITVKLERGASTPFYATPIGIATLITLAFLAGVAITAIIFGRKHLLFKNRNTRNKLYK